MRIFIATFLSFALLLSSAGYAQNEAQAGEKKSLVIKTTAGNVFDLSQKKGKVVMIAFWASWCTICKIEMNHINELYSKYNNSGLEIVGVNVDGKLGWGKDLKYPIAMMDNYSAGDFGFPRSIPLVYIVGKDGVIAQKFARPEDIKVDNLEGVIKGLLNEKNFSPMPNAAVPGVGNAIPQTPVQKTPVQTPKSEILKTEEKKTKFNFKKN